MAEAESLQPRLVSALEEVGRWRAQKETEGKARLAEIASERERLLSDIEELKREVAGLGELEDQVTTELTGLEGEETRRTRAAVDEGLQGDRALVDARDKVYASAVQDRKDRVAALLADEEITGLVEEFEQFQEVEATLASLPKGYRDSLRAHHDSVKQQLAPLVEAINAPLAPYEGDRAATTIVCSTNPAEGTPEALVVLIPVPYDVYSDWTERSEDLASSLAFRVIAAISAGLNAAGAADAPMQYVDYRGLLAVQVWLGEHPPAASLQDAVGEALDRLNGEASELAAAGVELYTAWLDPRVVQADEDEDVDDEVTGGGPVVSASTSTGGAAASVEG